MTKLITTKTTKFLTSLSGEPETSSLVYIKTLAVVDFKDWLNSLTPKQALWVADSNFSADKGQTIKLFDDSGKVTEIAVIKTMSQ